MYLLNIPLIIFFAQSVVSIFPISRTTVESVYPIIIHAGGEHGVFISSESGCQVISPQLRLHTNKKTRFRWYAVSDSLLKEMAKICQDHERDIISPTELVTSVQEQKRFIYPGTKYCGVGNSSRGFNDLGEYAETDKCCREHDSCQDYILGFGCHPINGLCNHTPFTRSSCSCDESFRKCLLSANETISNRIGKLFFDIFGLKCYRNDYPIINCMEYGGFFNIHCQRYRLDYNESQRLQFFDSPRFIQAIPGSQTEEENANELLFTYIY